MARLQLCLWGAGLVLLAAAGGWRRQTQRVPMRGWPRDAVIGPPSWGAHVGGTLPGGMVKMLQAAEGVELYEGARRGRRTRNSSIASMGRWPPMKPPGVRGGDITMRPATSGLLRTSHPPRPTPRP